MQQDGVFRTHDVSTAIFPLHTAVSMLQYSNILLMALIIACDSIAETQCQLFISHQSRDI